MHQFNYPACTVYLGHNNIGNQDVGYQKDFKYKVSALSFQKKNNFPVVCYLQYLLKMSNKLDRCPKCYGFIVEVEPRI